MKSKPQIKIAPSILSADFARVGEEVRAVIEAGADFIHVDVMDGHFVDNLTIGPPVVRCIKPHSRVPLDVHLMIETPEKWVEQYVDAGADILTIHVEACKEVEATLKKIKALGAKAGITLRPQTPLSEIKKFLPLCELVLVMTVNPGFGGQKFMHEQVEKVRELADWAKTHNPALLIEVDGGINSETAKIVVEAGANVLVAGNAVFKKDGYKSAIAALRG